MGKKSSASDQNNPMYPIHLTPEEGGWFHLRCALPFADTPIQFTASLYCPLNIDHTHARHRDLHV